MSKTRLIAAMPVGSRWNAFQHFHDTAPRNLGERKVARHRSQFMELYRVEKEGTTRLDYPKRTDVLTVSDDGNTVRIEYFEDGKNWSTVTYIHLKS